MGGSSYHASGIMITAFYCTNCSYNGCELLPWVTNIVIIQQGVILPWTCQEDRHTIKTPCLLLMIEIHTPYMSNLFNSTGGHSTMAVVRRTHTNKTSCLLPIRKSKDYVYGIWVYKALDIWKGYYRVKKSLVSYVKPWTEARNNKYMKYHSKLTYQLSFWNVSRKVDYHAGGKWFIHGPKRRKENQLLSLKHSCWLSLV